jgi:hypothetical protein
MPADTRERIALVSTGEVAALPLRRPVLALLACAALLAGCAVAGKSAAPTAAERASGADSTAASGDADSMLEGDDPRAEIERLWREVVADRAGIGLPPEVAPDALERMSAQPVSEARDSCERPDDPSVLCRDVCRLADSICDNAENICRLAGELGDDDWARDRCARATTSCGEAAERCCGC